MLCKIVYNFSRCMYHTHLNCSFDTEILSKGDIVRLQNCSHVWMVIHTSFKWKSIRKIRIRKIISSFGNRMNMRMKNGARKLTEIYLILLTASPFIWRINEMFHSPFIQLLGKRSNGDIDFKFDRLPLKGSHH